MIPHTRWITIFIAALCALASSCDDDSPTSTGPKRPQPPVALEAWRAEPSPVTAQLNDVAVRSDDSGWIVGDGGTLLSRTGGAWQAITVPTTQDLLSVAAATEADVVAVGRGGTILQRMGTDDWRAVPSPTPDDITSVAAGDEFSLYAVTSGGEVLARDAGVWSVMIAASELPGSGSFGALFAYASPAFGETLTFGGARGRSFHLSHRNPMDSTLVALDGITEDIVAIAGLPGPFVERFALAADGDLYRLSTPHWQGEVSARLPARDMAIRFSRENLITGATGEVLIFDGCREPYPMRLPAVQPINALHANGERAFAVGERGAIFVQDDALLDHLCPAAGATLTISTGGPEFSWDGDCRVWLVSVMHVATSTTVWGTESIAATGMAPPVRYGEVPECARPLIRAGDLMPGENYRVVLYGIDADFVLFEVASGEFVP